MSEPHELSYEPIPKRKHNPFYGFLALVAAIAVFLLSLQGYFYLIHPEPYRVVALSEVQTFLPADFAEPFTSHRPVEVSRVLQDAQPALKQVANYIAAQSCKKADAVCQSRAIFYFVRDRIVYVPDQNFHDQLENPLTVLKTGGADCEDMAVLAAGLLKAIGNNVRLVYIPGHAYAQVRIPDYKNGKWLNVETTCKTCILNEIPTDNALAKKTYNDL